MSISRPLSETEQLAITCKLYPTKSAQIRALAKDGWSRSKIANALGIRYQYVWNVLNAAEKCAPPLTSLFGPGKTLIESTAASASTCDFQYIDDALTNATHAVKQPLNLSINSSLIEAAKLLNVNLSELLERRLVEVLKQEAMARWQAENSEAIESSNRFFERHGLWSDGLRQF